MDCEPTPTRSEPNIVTEVSDVVRVEYPCDPALRSVGRVAVIGILLRLRLPMMAVEQFRSELDAAIGRAAGDDPDPGDSLAVTARWDDTHIVVDIAGPAGSETIDRPRVFR